MLISPIKIPTNFQGRRFQALAGIITAVKPKGHEYLADSFSSKVGAAAQRKLAKHPGAPKALSNFARWFFG